MSGFLLDTNVLSELRKGPRCNQNLKAWSRNVPVEELNVSVLVFGEIRKGIELVRRRDPKQSASLELWLRDLENDFAERALTITAGIADHWGRLMAIRPIPIVDGLLAATALEHSLTLVTRNTADVQHTGVSLLNPF